MLAPQTTVFRRRRNLEGYRAWVRDRRQAVLTRLGASVAQGVMCGEAGLTAYELRLARRAIRLARLEGAAWR